MAASIIRRPMYAQHNPLPTATPDLYPQGYFKDKKCRDCGATFTPNAPSQFFCSPKCAHRGVSTAYLRRCYGITLRDYEELLKIQNHRCAICDGEGFAMDVNRHKVKLVVDHDHATGRVRGLLCHNCNRALGLLQDSAQNLEAAITYLEGATTIPQGSRTKRSEAPGSLVK